MSRKTQAQLEDEQYEREMERAWLRERQERESQRREEQQRLEGERQRLDAQRLEEEIQRLEEERLQEQERRRLEGERLEAQRLEKERQDAERRVKHSRKLDEKSNSYEKDYQEKLRLLHELHERRMKDITFFQSKKAAVELYKSGTCIPDVIEQFDISRSTFFSWKRQVEKMGNDDIDQDAAVIQKHTNDLASLNDSYQKFTKRINVLKAILVDGRLVPEVAREFDTGERSIYTWKRKWLNGEACGGPGLRKQFSGKRRRLNDTEMDSLFTFIEENPDKSYIDAAAFLDNKINRRTVSSYATLHGISRENKMINLKKK